MSVSRRRFIAISAAAAIQPGRALAAQPKLRRWSGLAMGARASLAVSGLEESAFAKLVGEMTAEIERLERIFSLYRTDSELVRLNVNGQIDGPATKFVHLLSLAGSINRASGGAFDPTVQPLWQAYAASGGKPAASTLEQAGKQTGWQHVRVSADKIAFGRSGMAMTLNGIAQGFATDQVAGLMRRRGLENVLVSVGEVAALGVKQPAKPWRVGISETETGIAEETINLRDMAIATSAPAGMSFNTDRNVSHIIDPRTGLPVDHWRRVSVINPSAALADGLSTAFCVMTEPQILKTVKAFPGTRLIAISQFGKRVT